MDAQALRDAIAKRIRESTGGNDPSDTPIKPANRIMPSLNMDVTPSKPDPEAAANAQIDRAASRDPGIQTPSLNALSPEQQAIIKAHLDTVLAPVKGLIGPPPGQYQSPRPQQVDPATLMQQQGKPMPSDDVQSQDLRKQYYKKLSNDQDDDQDE